MKALLIIGIVIGVIAVLFFGLVIVMAILPEENKYEDRYKI